MDGVKCRGVRDLKNSQSVLETRLAIVFICSAEMESRA